MRKLIPIIPDKMEVSFKGDFAKKKLLRPIPLEYVLQVHNVCIYKLLKLLSFDLSTQSQDFLSMENGLLVSLAIIMLIISRIKLLFIVLSLADKSIYIYIYWLVLFVCNVYKCLIALISLHLFASVTLMGLL